MTDHEAGPRTVRFYAEAFIKRPGMYLGRPIRIDRALPFLRGYEAALFDVRLATHDLGNVHLPAGPVAQFETQLSAEGRVRWHSLELTLAAEAIGWTQQDPPVLDELTEEQHHAAISLLLPLVEQLFALPDTLVTPERS